MADDIKAIARRGEQVLVASGDAGVIVNERRGTVSPRPLRVGAILARGYWGDFQGDPRQALELATPVFQALTSQRSIHKLGLASHLDGLEPDELMAVWFHTVAALDLLHGITLWSIGDFAELLVQSRLGGTRANNSGQPGYDILLEDGTRVQVKAMVKRPGRARTSIGYFKLGLFDQVVVVRFDEARKQVDVWRFGPEVVVSYGSERAVPGVYRLSLTAKLQEDDRVERLDWQIPRPD